MSEPDLYIKKRDKPEHDGKTQYMEHGVNNLPRPTSQSSSPTFSAAKPSTQPPSLLAAGLTSTWPASPRATPVPSGNPKSSPPLKLCAARASPQLEPWASATADGGCCGSRRLGSSMR